MTHAELLTHLENLPNNDGNLRALTAQMQTSIGVVPFVGAGMSVPFGFIQWTALLRRLAELANMKARIEEHIAAGRYEEAAGDLTTHFGAGFQQLIAHNFGDDLLKGRQYTGPISYIAKLSAGPVITTNFDRLLENAFLAGGCPFDSVRWHGTLDGGITALRTNSPMLLKIHGDWEDPMHRVLTLVEYCEQYGDPDGDLDTTRPLPQLFELLAMRPVLFLGCSLNADRTVKILSRIAGKLPTSLHFAIAELPDDKGQARRREAELDSWNIRPIWYPEGKHEKLEPLLEYLSEQTPTPFRRVRKWYTSPVAAKDTIPTPLTKFIGREPEQQELLQRVEEFRLVTVAGPPGSGKTRLAIEVARTLRKHFDAVWYIPLSQIRDNQAVPQRIAHVLGIGEQGSRPLEDALADKLKAGHCLLVLDTCEHILATCVALTTRLLEECPELKILTTSRVTLQVDGENVYDLPPLELPDPENLPDLEALKLIDSVELLLARSKARSNFQLTSENAVAVSTLCVRLQGIPLAVELAAAQMDLLTVDTILAHMNESLELLVASKQGAGDRHWRTLREAIALSFDLLDEPQRTLLRRASVFHRGWTWEAAGTICREVDQNELGVLQLLGDLRNASLISPEGGDKRFRLLDSIREFAAGKLRDASEDADVKERHARWFTAWAERMSPDLLRGRHSACLHEMTADADNLRAAMLWSVAHAQTEVALRIAASVWRVYEIKSFYREGCSRLRAVLGMPDSAQFPALRSKVLSGLSVLAYRQGDLETAEVCSRESLEIETAADNAPGIANALNDLGNVALMRGDYEGAHEFYSRSLVLYEGSEDARGIAVAFFNSGNAARRLGLADEARAKLLDSLQRFEAQGNMRDAAFPLNALAWVECGVGDYDVALAFTDRAMAIRKGLSDRRGMAESMRAEAAVRIRTGQLAEARRLLRDSATIAEAIEDKRSVAETHEAFATLAAAEGDLKEAIRRYTTAETIREQIRLPLPPVDRIERDALLSRTRTPAGTA